jgi:hypothetical protein
VSSRTRTSSRRSLSAGPWQAAQQGAELLVREYRDDLAVELGRLQAGQRIGIQLTLLGQPGGEASQRELPGSGGGRLPAIVQQLGDERGDGGPVERRRPALPLAPGQEGADPVAYSRTVPSALRSARKWMIQLSSSARRSGSG